MTSLTGKPCEKLVIQESAAPRRQRNWGTIARKLIQEMSRMKPVPLSFDRLTVGLSAAGPMPSPGLRRIRHRGRR